jgi:lipopolysaccharide biosynthesis glycosyltransferase
MPTPDRPRASGTKTCICYISDEGYLFPSLVSIRQLKKHVNANDADIIMFCIGAESRTTEAFRTIYEQIGVRFFMVPRDAIDNMHIMFARLFIDRFAPAEYSQFLYIDGDTQIATSVDALVNVVLPADRFCAAP